MGNSCSGAHDKEEQAVIYIEDVHKLRKERQRKAVQQQQQGFRNPTSPVKEEEVLRAGDHGVTRTSFLHHQDGTVSLLEQIQEKDENSENILLRANNISEHSRREFQPYQDENRLQRANKSSEYSRPESQAYQSEAPLHRANNISRPSGWSNLYQEKVLDVEPDEALYRHRRIDSTKSEDDEKMQETDSHMVVDFTKDNFLGHYQLHQPRNLGLPIHTFGILEFSFWPQGEFEISALTKFDNRKVEQLFQIRERELWVYGRIIPDFYHRRKKALPVLHAQDLFSEEDICKSTSLPWSEDYDIGVEIYYRRIQLTKSKMVNYDGQNRVEQNSGEKFSFINKRFGLNLTSSGLHYEKHAEPRHISDDSIVKMLEKKVNMHWFPRKSAMFKRYASYLP